MITDPESGPYTDGRGSRSPTYPDINISMVAEAVGISRAQVSRIINGVCRNPSYKRITDIAAAIGITQEELVVRIQECQSAKERVNGNGKGKRKR